MEIIVDEHRIRLQSAKIDPSVIGPYPCHDDLIAFAQELQKWPNAAQIVAFQNRKAIGRIIVRLEFCRRTSRIFCPQPLGVRLPNIRTN